MASTIRRRALIVGIETYENDTLPGCEEDAEQMRDVLSVHATGEPNYRTKTVTSQDTDVKRDVLRNALHDLFANSAGHDLLFYFAGHGVVSTWGADLVTYEYSHPATGGVSMQEIMTLAHNSEAREIVIILDCCYSGSFAEVIEANDRKGVARYARLRRDMTVLAASRPHESAMGSVDGGEFTNALIRGLQGGAADHLGDVTPMGLYTFALQTFGTDTSQQPVFKGDHSFPPVLRKMRTNPRRDSFDQLPGLFVSEEEAIEITPAHLERAADGHTQSQEEKDFAELLELQALGLLQIEGPCDLSGAVAQGPIVRLSPMGRYYWWLSTERRLPWLDDD